MSIQKHFTKANIAKSYKNAPSNLKSTAKIAPGVISRAGKSAIAKGKYFLAGGAYGASMNERDACLKDRAARPASTHKAGECK